MISIDRRPCQPVKSRLLLDLGNVQKIEGIELDVIFLFLNSQNSIPAVFIRNEFAFCSTEVKQRFCGYQIHVCSIQVVF